MKFCQACGKESLKLSTCGNCKNVVYCNRKCQKKDWKSHKLACHSFQEMQELDQDLLPMRFVNPRKDRSISKHGKDTSALMQISDPLDNFMKRMNLNVKNAAMMYIHDEVIGGGYGRCFGNVDTVIKKHGGTSVCGWMMFENEYLIELEAHCVWKPSQQDQYVNVTSNSSGKPFSGLFVEDSYVQLATVFKTSPIQNVVYWK